MKNFPTLDGSLWIWSLLTKQDICSTLSSVMDPTKDAAFTRGKVQMKRQHIIVLDAMTARMFSGEPSVLFFTNCKGMNCWSTAQVRNHTPKSGSSKREYGAFAKCATAESTTKTHVLQFHWKMRKSNSSFFTSKVLFQIRLLWGQVPATSSLKGANSFP